MIDDGSNLVFFCFIMWFDWCLLEVCRKCFGVFLILVLWVSGVEKFFVWIVLNIWGFCVLVKIINLKLRYGFLKGRGFFMFYFFV